MASAENAPVDETLDSDAAGEEAAKKLTLDVQIATVSACQRHITVTIPREDIDRYFDEAFSDLVGKATVPGFRAGRAHKLVESRFRKDVADQIKGSLLMDSLAQLTEEHNLAAISEPDLDLHAVEVPDEGPMTYEFNLEVRPEFDLPNWKGLHIERPTYQFTEKDIDRRLQNVLAQHGQLAPFDGPAESGDYVVVNLTFKHGDQVVSSSQDEVIRVRPVLSFRDGKIEGFDTLMAGAKSGETRVGKAKLTNDAPNVQLRGQEIDAVFEVLEVKKLELPEMTPAFLTELGDFDSEEELRTAVKATLERQLKYNQQQRVRQQITASLTEAADWELPPDMLRRQSQREFERAILELRSSGFDDNEIRNYANTLRQNSAASTARALKEHFILERIAEEEKIEELPEDFDYEIAMIAQQSGESVRRVRAQIEKRQLLDTLRNQIIERKTIDLILSHATFKDVAYKPETVDSEAVDQSAGGGDAEAEIPEAKYGEGPASELPGQERERNQ